MTVSFSRVFLLIAVIVFVLVGFDVTIGNLTQLEELSFGLAFFAAAGLVP